MPTRLQSRTDPDAIASFRRSLAKAYARFYEGWSDAVDDAFEARATWYVEDAGDSGRCFVRLVERGPGLLLPTQALAATALIGPAAEAAAEINNFLYSPQDQPLAVQLVMQILLDLEHRQAGDCLCVVDEKRAEPLALNTQVFGFRDTGQVVEFSGYCDRDTRQPVRWRVLLQSPADRGAALARVGQLR